VDKVSKREAGQYVGSVLAPSGKAVKTIKDEISELSTFWRWCVGRGIAEVNPFFGMAETIRPPKRGKSDEGRREWTDEELKTLLQGIKDHRGIDDPLFPLTVIAAYSGMRGGEIAFLETKDVHLDAAVPYFHIREGKSKAAVRDVPIHSAIIPLIRRLKSGSKDGRLISGLQPAGRDAKLFHLQGKRFTTLKKKLGFTDNRLVFHCLRKSFIGHMERAGVQLNVMQQIVGHDKGSLALGTYSGGLELETLKETVEKVDYGDEVARLL
jgi:integrase